MLLNAAGQVVSDGAYTAWGALNSASYPDTPFAWKGQGGAYRDSESGYVQMGERLYSPALGRFLSRDPSGFSAGPNLYGYCAGDPVNFYDPDGCKPRNFDEFWNEYTTGTGWFSADQYFLTRYSNALKAHPIRGFGGLIPDQDPISMQVISLTDAWARGGAVAGNPKASPEETMQTQRDMALQTSMAALMIYDALGMDEVVAEAEANIAASRLRGGCFVAGTPVQTMVRGKDGKYHIIVKHIEKVRQGDLVLARSEATGKIHVRRVLKSTVRTVDRVLTVALVDADTHKVVEKITATREHPFYVRGKGFIPAGGLAVGNAIVTRAGPALVVQSIKWNRRAEGYKVYNFVVEDDHSYFVGKSSGGAWVHNPDICWKGFSDGKLKVHFEKHVEINKEFGNITQSSYLKMAKGFAAEAGEFQVGTEGSFLVKFDPATRRTLVGHMKHREIRTFYIASEDTLDPFAEAIAFAKGLSR